MHQYHDPAAPPHHRRSRLPAGPLLHLFSRALPVPATDKLSVVRPTRPLHPTAPDAPRRVPFPAGLYLILDPAVAGSLSLPDLVKTALTTGVRFFQLRMKTPHAGEFYDLAVQVCALVRAGGGTFIVNDRVDVAQAVGADGVHLGQEDLPLADARAILGSDKLIGISTHTMKQAFEADAGGTDYVGFRPICMTSTQEHPAPVVGMTGL